VAPLKRLRTHEFGEVKPAISDRHIGRKAEAHRAGPYKECPLGAMRFRSTDLSRYRIRRNALAGVCNYIHFDWAARERAKRANFTSRGKSCGRGYSFGPASDLSQVR
jgi:hypothetical protein